MRSAAASFDDDFDLPRPSAKRRSEQATGRKRPVGGAKSPRAAKRTRFPMRSVARYAAMAMSAAFVVAIVANALIEQKGQHPAPLFGTAIALGNAAPAARPHVAPPAAPRAAQTRQTSVASMPETPPAALPRPIVPARVAASEGSGGDDPIARLISGGAAQPTVRKTKRHVTAATETSPKR